MKREDLQKIEGLTKEQIDAIMGLHQVDVTAWNAKIDEQKGIVKERDATIVDLTDKVKKFDGVDVTKLQNDLKEWQTKYDEGLTAKDREFAQELLFRNYEFSSDMAKKAAMMEFNSKELKFENGKFIGADDFFKDLKEKDPGAFKETNPNPNSQRKTGMEQGGTGGNEGDDPVTARFKELNPDIKL